MTLEDGHKRSNMLGDKLVKFASYDMLDQIVDLFDDAACCYEADISLAAAVMCRAALDSMLRCLYAASYKVAKITPNSDAPSGVSIELNRVYAIERNEVVIGRREMDNLFIGQPVLAVPVKRKKICFPKISEMRQFLVDVGVFTQLLSDAIERARVYGHRAAHLEERWMKMAAQKMDPSLNLEHEREADNPYVRKDEARQALEVVENALLCAAERWDNLAAPVQVPARTRVPYS
jgi:hypothetical protein